MTKEELVSYISEHRLDNLVQVVTSRAYGDWAYAGRATKYEPITYSLGKYDVVFKAFIPKDEDTTRAVFMLDDKHFSIDCFVSSWRNDLTLNKPIKILNVEHKLVTVTEERWCFDEN